MFVALDKILVGTRSTTQRQLLGRGNRHTMFMRRTFVWIGLLTLSILGVPSAQAEVTLENTSWEMTYLGDMPVRKTGSMLMRPMLTLTSGARRMSGSGGCNEVRGDYKLSGDQLTFGETMVITVIHCPGRLMEMEKTFLDALQRVKHWKIEGQLLTLLDADGSELARFEAVQRLKRELDSSASELNRTSR